MNTTTISTSQYLAKAVEIASNNVRNAGGPFGAIVVAADGQIFEGVNRVCSCGAEIAVEASDCSGGYETRLVPDAVRVEAVA